ncbi:hypothetical protein K4K98_11030 [Phaeobacter inhibens]|nr:hypothetical protein K4K98_11030 [Phaeobacter inhibens]
MTRRETMRAEMVPDVYADQNCDQHEPRWMGSTEGDIDSGGDVGIDGVILLDAKIFPPGTKITVSEPECPDCGTVPTLQSTHPAEQIWQCECDHDWRAWANTEFS